MGGIPFDLGAHDDAEAAELLGGVRPRRRSLWALGALGCGYTLARFWMDHGDLPAPPVWFAVCQALLAATLIVRGRPCRAVLFLAVCAFAGGWFAFRFDAASPARLDRALGIDGDPSARVVATVHGTVLDAPRQVVARAGILGRFAHTAPSWVFELSTDRAEADTGPIPVSGVVRVSVRSGPPAIAPGDRVRVTGEFRAYSGPVNPGEPDRRLLALQEGVVGRLIIPGASLVQTISPSAPAGAWPRFVGWARGRAARAIEIAPGPPGPPGSSGPAAAADPGRALLGAMLLGSREQGIDEVDAAFRRIGLVHLVAISGFNLALLAWAASLIFRLSGGAVVGGRLESVGVAALVGMYLLIVPAESPILRAGVTVLAFLLSESMGRRYDRVTLLGWIACGLLIWRPLDLWSLGFQLSFGIVGVLLWLGTRAEGRIFGVPLRGVVSVGIPIGHRRGPLARLFAPVWREGSRVLKRVISASLLAWGIAAPIIVVQTGVFSPWAPLTGLLVLPLASATLIVGYGALLVGFVWPDAGAFVGSAAEWGAGLLARAVMTLDAIPGASIEAPSISALWGIAAVGTVLYWFARGHLRNPLAWALAAGVSAWFLVEARLNTSLGSGVVARVDMIAVGDGTCHLVRSGREAMLWDCGSSNPGLGLRELPRAVRALGSPPVRAALVTHANLDHFLCLPDVVEPLGIKRVYVTSSLLETSVADDGSATAALVRELRARRVELIPLQAGSVIPLGEVSIEILSPPTDAAFADVNDTSLVGLLRAPISGGEQRVLFTGDIGPAAITRLRREHPELHADVLELPHHGSARPEAIAWTQDVGPRVVLQSTGPQRLNDRRWDAAKAGRVWYTSAADGASWVELGGEGVKSGKWKVENGNGK